MSLSIKKGDCYIRDLDEWIKFASPKGKGKQWVDKRSAKEFARYMLSNNKNLPIEVDGALKDLTDCSEFVLYPECLTSFYKYGMGQRGPRNHDGLLIGDDIVVGIEAKSDERFDAKYLSQYDSSKQRYSQISKHIFGDGPENHTNIRYQLVSASMGTMIEALERKCEKAVLLIISFISKEKTNPKNIRKSKEDLLHFINSLKKGEQGDFITPFSEKNKIKFFIKCIDINLDN